MVDILEKIKKVLPFQQTQQANNKRNSVWEKWDTNSFKFMNIKDIQEELCDLFIISSQDSILIKKAFKLTKESVIPECKLGEQIFLQNLTNLFEIMVVFDVLNPRKRTSIGSKQIQQASKVLCKWNLDDQKYVQILSIREQLNFDSFVDLITEQQTSNVFI